MQSRADDYQANNGYQSDDSDLPKVEELCRRVRKKDNATESLVISAKPVAQIRQLKFYNPISIYRRYVGKRRAWYENQLVESTKTNEIYRKAMELPADYQRHEYKWCVEASQMGQYCTDGRSKRRWTKEEKMAYLDWSTQEDKRWEAKEAKDYNPAAKAGLRPCREMLAAAERDTREQEKLYKILDMGNTKETAILIE